MKPSSSVHRAFAKTMFFATVAFLSSCQHDLPMAPSDLTGGVVVYEHANFLGNSAHITTSVADLKDFRGPCEHTDTDATGNSTVRHDWNDCISSIRITPSWRAIVYRDDDFKGQSLETTADVPNLQLVPGSCPHDGLNDCITSIRVFAP